MNIDFKISPVYEYMRNGATLIANQMQRIAHSPDIQVSELLKEHPEIESKKFEH